MSPLIYEPPMTAPRPNRTQAAGRSAIVWMLGAVGGYALLPWMVWAGVQDMSVWLFTAVWYVAYGVLYATVRQITANHGERRDGWFVMLADLRAAKRLLVGVVAAVDHEPLLGCASFDHGVQRQPIDEHRGQTAGVAGCLKERGSVGAQQCWRVVEQPVGARSDAVQHRRVDRQRQWRCHGASREARSAFEGEGGQRRHGGASDVARRQPVDRHDQHNRTRSSHARRVQQSAICDRRPFGRSWRSLPSQPVPLFGRAGRVTPGLCAAPSPTARRRSATAQRASQRRQRRRVCLARIVRSAAPAGGGPDGATTIPLAGSCSE